MKPLSKEASAALSALQATDPTSADEARVRRNLERALGVMVPAASVAAATTAATAHAATGASGLSVMGLGAKAVAFVMAVGIGAAITVTTVSAVKTVPTVPPESSRGVTAVTNPVPPESSRGVTAVTDPVPPESSRGVTAVTDPVPPESSRGLTEVADTVPPESSRGLTEVADTVPPERSRGVAIDPEPVVEIAITQVQPVAPSRLRAPPPPIAHVEVAAAPAPTAAPEQQDLPSPPPPPAEPEISEAAYELEIEANFPNCDSRTEMRAALSARRLLNADRAEESLWLLGAYQRRCPSGRWSNEAWVVRMAGLCQLDRNAEVTGLLQWFSTEYPGRRVAVVSELGRFCSENVLKHGEPSAE